MKVVTTAPLRTTPVLLAILAVLALAIMAITWWLRAGLREQILRREGESLYAVTVLQHALERERLDEFSLGSDDERLAILALQTSRLQGVLGAQGFTVEGGAMDSALATVAIPPPSARDWEVLRNLRPVVQFFPRATPESLTGMNKRVAAGEPLLRITVPLHAPEETSLEGAVGFVLEGQAVAREFARLDRSLLWQASLVWLLSGGVSLAGVGWVLRRLTRAHRDLAARTDDLIRANRALSLGAKTSALGAITAHLVHGLRNPLAGLESFIQEQGNGESAQFAEAWTEANATTRRMREMVNEVVTLLQDQESGASYEVTWREALDMAAARVAQPAAVNGVTVAIETEKSGVMTNHQAGLVAAILTNLAQNACEALKGCGGTVTLRVASGAVGEVEFCVMDNGPGLPTEVAQRPFEPRLSTKPGSAGIGLAISQQLAAHLGGSLELVSTGPTGTNFRLRAHS